MLGYRVGRYVCLTIMFTNVDSLNVQQLCLRHKHVSVCVCGCGCGCVGVGVGVGVCVGGCVSVHACVCVI